MADLSDVMNTLAGMASSSLYPTGIPAGDDPASAAGVPVICYPGWPDPATLDADLAAGKAHVSVYPLPGERNTTRFPADWQPLENATETLTAFVSGQTVLIGGTVSTPQNVEIFANGLPFVYAVQSGDTLATIAAAVAAMIATNIAGTVSAGPLITLPSSARLGAALIGASGTAIKEVRRQERMLQVTVWANTPETRDAIARVVDTAFAEIERFVLPDQTYARLIYQSSPMSDSAQRDNLYRRDFIFSVEYATTVTETETEITAETINIAAKNDGATAYQPVVTINF